jgi:CDP-diacylglycerol---glycerol-3-phosphate 3-phosphatidyltransferase
MLDARRLRTTQGSWWSTITRSHFLKRCVAILKSRREHRSEEHWKHAICSRANGLTLVRSVLASCVLGVAVYQESRALLIAGLVASWVGDVADGHLARSKGCETVLGAQVDGLADRLTALWVVVGAVLIAKGSGITVAAAVAVWLQFGVLDHALSAQFVRHDRWTADEFHLDDVVAWRLNWAPLAKVLSNVPVGLLAVGGIGTWGALAGAALLLVIRTGSSLRLLAGLPAQASKTSSTSHAPVAITARRSTFEATSTRELNRERDEIRLPAQDRSARLQRVS